MTRSRAWTAAAMVCLLGVLVAAVGCGSSSSSTSSSAASTQGASTASGGSTKLNVKPRTIALVLTAGQSPISQANTRTIKAAAAMLGWKVESTDGQGDPAQMLRAANAYVTQGVDAVLFDSTQADWVRPALVRLKAAGVPAIEYSAGNPVDPLFTAQYMEDEKQVGLELGKLITQNVPNARIGEIKSSFYAGSQRALGLREAVSGPDANGAKIVAGVEPNLVNVVPATTKGVTDMLTAHPEINAIYSVYDNYTQAIAATLRAKGSKAKIFAPYMTPPQFAMLSTSSSPLSGLMNVDNPTTAAVAIDQLISHFEKGTPIDKNALQQHPLTYKLITRQNLPASPDALLGPDVILKPFISEWESEYGK